MGRVVAKVVVVAGLVVGMVVPFGGRVAAQEGPPSLTLSPATDLVDAQVVDLQVSNFRPPFLELRMSQCPTGATTLAQCHQPLIRAATGTYGTRHAVRTILRTPAGPLDCRQPDACMLAAGVDDGSGTVPVQASAPMHFAPEGPLVGPPTTTISPAGPLTDGQQITVQGTGFIRQQSFVATLLCAAEPRSQADCDMETFTFGFVFAGDFTSSLPAYAVLDTAARGLVDCRVPGNCVAASTSDFAAVDDTAITPLVFDPATPPAPRPRLEAHPATDLVDGQSVLVLGHDFPRHIIRVSVYQCAPDPTAARCRLLVENLDSNGSISGDVMVSARVAGVDCRTSASPCLLVAVKTGGATPASPRGAITELHFDPDGPVLPEPEVTVTPTDDLGDFTSFTVEGHNFTAGSDVAVRVCHAVEQLRCDERNGEVAKADAAGVLAMDLAGFSRFDVANVGRVDCREVPGCVVTVTDRGRGARAVAPLTFGPPSAPRGRYRDPVFADISVERNLVYRHTTDSEGRPVDLALDVVQPVGDTATTRPAIVLLHGGYFIVGQRQTMEHWAGEYARRGYVAITMSYRLRPNIGTTDPQALLPASLDAYDDVTAGVEWLQAHAADFRIDPDAIVAGGYSAGAVLAYDLAFLPGQRGPDTPLIAGAQAVAGWLYAEPDAGEAPTIGFHGTADPIIPIANADQLCPTAEPLGIPCAFVSYGGDTHSIDRRKDDILRRTTDFFADHVLAPRGYFDVTAAADGPYTVAEGSTVTLDPSGSTGSGLSFTWSPSGPSIIGVDDGTATYTLTATNAYGVAATDAAEVTTTNVAPTITSVSTSGAPTSRTVTLDAAFTDPGSADTHTAVVDWGDGTVTPAAGGVHEYARGGEYQITLTVTDDDGGTATSSVMVSVGCTAVGTPGLDILLGGPGNDVLCGLAGNDILIGAAGDDILLGGPGNDLLLGLTGNDTLHGGPNTDTALGGPGTDHCTAERRHTCER